MSYGFNIPYSILTRNAGKFRFVLNKYQTSVAEHVWRITNAHPFQVSRHIIYTAVRLSRQPERNKMETFPVHSAFHQIRNFTIKIITTKNTVRKSSMKLCNCVRAPSGKYDKKYTRQFSTKYPEVFK